MTAETKEFQRAPIKHFQDAVKALGMTERDLVQGLGYSRNSGNAWLKAGSMPLVAAKLCDALVRDAQSRKSGVLVITWTTPEQRTTLSTMAHALGCKIVELA